MASDTTLRPGEIKDILLKEIEAADLHELDVEEVGSILEVKDGIARIYGLGKAMAGEMLEVHSAETGATVTALARSKTFCFAKSKRLTCTSWTSRKSAPSSR